MPKAPNSGSTPTTATPPLLGRILATAAIIIAGLCGGLIGYAVTDLQCNDGCQTLASVVGVGAALGAATGVAIVSVLSLRAMSEWEATQAAREVDAQ